MSNAHPAPVSQALPPRVVIVGAGFGGLSCAQALARSGLDVTVIDRQNHHLFQPLLYQVAAAALSPDDIAAPIRRVLRGAPNIDVIMAEVCGVDFRARQVLLRDGDPVPYDQLVLATGCVYSYFGHADWPRYAPSLKSADDALLQRRRLLMAFERAEAERDPAERRRLLTFVIVGGGPTGVEMAGALVELARVALRDEFRNIDPAGARVVLVEASDAILAGFPPDLSAYAQRELEKKGVEVRVKAPLTHLGLDGVRLGAVAEIACATVVWCAGVKATPVADWLGVASLPNGTVPVGPDLTVPGRPEIFVIGDAAFVPWRAGRGLPGLATVAKQQGKYAAKVLRARATGAPAPAPFAYRDPGALATIGRAAAIADFRWLHLTGRLGWLVWAVAHIWYLIGFRNRMVVFVTWMWAWATYGRGARLILGEDSPPGAPDARPQQPGPTLTSRAAPAEPDPGAAVRAG